MTEDKKKCEEEKAKLTEILQDIKVETRDLDDFHKRNEMKKTIKSFESEIDIYCNEENIQKRKEKGSKKE